MGTMIDWNLDKEDCTYLQQVLVQVLWSLQLVVREGVREGGHIAGLERGRERVRDGGLDLVNVSVRRRNSRQPCRPPMSSYTKDTSLKPGIYPCGLGVGFAAVLHVCKHLEVGG